MSHAKVVRPLFVLIFVAIAVWVGAGQVNPLEGGRTLVPRPCRPLPPLLPTPKGIVDSRQVAATTKSPFRTPRWAATWSHLAIRMK